MMIRSSAFIVLTLAAFAFASRQCHVHSFEELADVENCDGGWAVITLRENTTLPCDLSGLGSLQIYTGDEYIATAFVHVPCVSGLLPLNTFLYRTTFVGRRSVLRIPDQAVFIAVDCTFNSTRFEAPGDEQLTGLIENKQKPPMEFLYENRDFQFFSMSLNELEKDVQYTVNPTATPETTPGYGVSVFSSIEDALAACAGKKLLVRDANGDTRSLFENGVEFVKIEKNKQ